MLDRGGPTNDRPDSAKAGATFTRSGLVFDQMSTEVGTTWT